MDRETWSFLRGQCCQKEDYKFNAVSVKAYFVFWENIFKGHVEFQRALPSSVHEAVTIPPEAG